MCERRGRGGGAPRARDRPGAGLLGGGDLEGLPAGPGARHGAQEHLHVRQQEGQTSLQALSRPLRGERLC